MNDQKNEEKEKEVQKLHPREVGSPFERFSDSGFFRDMDRFIEQYLPRRWGQQFGQAWPGHLAGHMTPFGGKTPRVDVIDRESDFLIKAELPGVEKNDINITLANNMLTLEASMSKEEKEDKAEYFRREICRGTYKRTIELPAAVKEEDAKATFENGVLELIIPKMEMTKRSTIKVE